MSNVEPSAPITATQPSWYPDVSGNPDVPPISPRLYNRDLAPTKREGRRWSSYNIFALWVNDVHSLGNYGFALGLFALGLGGWQIILALGIAALLLFGLLQFSAMMGHKTGVPFPVLGRISFGIFGAQIPGIVRGATAIVWFGIQTYLASLVLNVLVIALFPGLKGLDHGSFLGLPSLGWMTFGGLWIIQTVIVQYGMDGIRKYEAYVGPLVLVTMTALAVWILTQTHWSIAWTGRRELTGGAMWVEIFAAAALWVAIYATFVLNFCDFTRGSKTRKSIVNGTLWGILINTVFFACIVVVMAGGEYKINGTVIASPADVIQAVPNTLLVVLASLVLVVLTIAVNLMANFVAPIYMLNNLFPKHLNFRLASLICAVIGFIILPWNLYNSPIVIDYFLGGLGGLLGPLFGVIMADYWLIRRDRVNTLDLFTEGKDGDYYYRNGFNPRAIWSFVIAAIIALAIAFIPAMGQVASFSWFIGAGIGAVVYSLMADKKRPFRDVSGEPIAVSGEPIDVLGEPIALPSVK